MIAKSGRHPSQQNLEELLVSAKLLKSDQVPAVHKFMAEAGVNFATAVMYLRMVPSVRIAEVLELERRIRSVQPQKLAPIPHLKTVIAAERAKELQVFPLQVLDDSGQPILILGMTDPLERVTIQRVEEMTRRRVQPVFMSLDDLQWAYRKHYRSGLTLLAGEPTNAGERTVNRRLSSLVATHSRESGTASSSLQAEFKALLRILIRKGVLTQEELGQEMARHAP